MCYINWRGIKVVDIYGFHYFQCFIPVADIPPFSGAFGFEQVIGSHSGSLLLMLLLSSLLNATDHSPLVRHVAFLTPTSL